MEKYCLCFFYCYCRRLSLYVYYIKFSFSGIYSLTKPDNHCFTKIKIIAVFNRIGNRYKSALRYQLIIDTRVIKVNIDMIITTAASCVG